MKNKMTIYTPVSINPADSGFGMYQSDHCQPNPFDSWAEKGELIHEMTVNSDRFLKLEHALEEPDFIELGVEDIRGRIYNQPTHLYAQMYENTVRYIGIVETEVGKGYFDNEEVK